MEKENGVITLSETRVRVSVKQTAKGALQMDLTAEAPTSEQAIELLGVSLDNLKAELSKRGLKTTEEA